MMEFLETTVSWQTFLLALVVFGFAPGFVLRLLVKIYPRDDPRRNELVAQLYTLGRIERPFFVAEQLETVLFEGLPTRGKATWVRIKQTNAPTWSIRGLAWAAQKVYRLIGARRGRAFTIVPAALPAQVDGMWIAMSAEDFILYRKDITQRQKARILCREIWHLLLEGRSVEGGNGDLIGKLWSELDSAMVKRILT